jgi:hypothetical protein
MGRIVALAAFVVLATAANSFAVTVSAPELDANTALTALTLLSGSAAVLRARLKR